MAQVVNVAGMGARNPALAFQGQVEAFAVFAHPADLFGGNADHQGVIGYVTVDDGTGTDKGIASDGDAANDGAVSAQGRALLDVCRTVLVLARYGGARVVDVCEDHARTAKDVVLEGDVVIDRDVVLHLDVVADLDAVADEYVLAERAFLADTGTATDMHPVPNAGVLAYGGAFIDDGGFVYLVVHKSLSCLPRTVTEKLGCKEPEELRSRHLQPSVLSVFSVATLFANCFVATDCHGNHGLLFKEPCALFVLLGE